MTDSNPFSDPNYGLEPGQQAAVNPFSDPNYGKEEKSGLIRRVLGDGAVSLLKGAISVPEAAVGLVDIVTGGWAGKAAEGIGIRFDDAKKGADELFLSPEQKLANQNVSKADGFTDKLGAIVANPSVIPHALLESAPLIGGGGVIGRGVAAAAPKVAPWAAGAIGEGTVMAGSQAENIRNQTEDGLLTGKQSLAALGTGVVGGAIGAGGAALGRSIGLGDIDTAMVSGAMGQSSRGATARIAGGAVQEGLLEEMPQSAAEQALQNYALDREIGEGVGGAAAMGLVTGGAMGAGFGAVSGRRAQQDDPATDSSAAPVTDSAADPNEPPPLVVTRGADGPDLIQPTPTAENPAPAPVERPDPANGPLSAAASMLPGAAPQGPEATPAGQQEQPAPASPEEARIREAIADVEMRARLGGMTPVLAAERARLGGELLALQQPATEQQERPAIADQRSDFYAGSNGFTSRERDPWVNPASTRSSDPYDRFPGIDQVPPQPLEGELLTDEPVGMDGRGEQLAGQRGIGADARPRLMREGELMGGEVVPQGARAGLGRGETFDGQNRATPTQAQPRGVAPVRDPLTGELVGGDLQAQQERQRLDGRVIEGELSPREQRALATTFKKRGAAELARKSLPAPEGYTVEEQGGTFAIRQLPPPTPSIAGREIDSEWSEFAPESGTLAIPRAQMPQVKAEHRGAMVRFLNARGIQHEEQTVPAAELKPTQAEFSRQKVAQAKGFTGGDRAILVSSDGHVVDGHHQWLAKREAGGEVRVIRLKAQIRDLLPVVAEFPSSTVDDASQMAVKDAAPAAPESAPSEVRAGQTAEAPAVQPPAAPRQSPVEVARELAIGNHKRADYVGRVFADFTSDNTTDAQRAEILREFGIAGTPTRQDFKEAVGKYWDRNWRARTAKKKVDAAEVDRITRELQVEATINAGLQAAAEMDAQRAEQQEQQPAEAKPPSLKEGIEQPAEVIGQPEPKAKPAADQPTPSAKPKMERAKPPAPEAPKWAASLAEDVAGEVPFWNDEVALVVGHSIITGQPVYGGALRSRETRTRVDIQAYTGSAFTTEQKALLLRERERLVKEEAAAQAAHPDGPFTGGRRIAKSEGVDKAYADYLASLIDKLGLDDLRVFLLHPSDVRGNRAKHKLHGSFASAASAGMDSGEDGSVRALGDRQGDFYIAIRPRMSRQRTIEAIAHELGHIIEKVAYNKADAKTRQAIQDAYGKWLEKTKGMTAPEVIRALRNAETAEAHAATVTEDTRLTPYWTSFAEWFADNTSRLATNPEQPQSLMDKFFKQVAKSLRKLAAAVSGNPFAPDAQVAKFLDGMASKRSGTKIAPAVGQSASPSNWRKNFIQARQYAKALGVPVESGQKLAEVVAAIDGHLFEQPGQAAPESASDVPLFSRRPVDVAGSAGAVLEHDAVKAIVERINARLGLGTELRVYRSEAELFGAVPEIGQQADKDGANGQINAVFHDGKVHVVTSAFVRGVDVETAILDALAHEGQGHYGIRALFDGDKAAIDVALREVFAAIGGVAGVRRIAAKNGIDLSLYLKTAEGLSERHRAAFLADELLAHLQGKAATAGLTARAMAAIRAYIGEVREWLRAHGFINLAKGTDADIALLLKRMREASTRVPNGMSKGKPRLFRRGQTQTEAFKRWFGDSKAVDATGNPLVLHHGTAAEFTIFEQSRAGSSTGHATSPLGIFMAADTGTARAYAEKAGDGMPGLARVMSLYASIRNPYTMTLEESQALDTPLKARSFRSSLERQGYDGIRLQGTPVWIAFGNYQVKSATDNIGTFDEFDPDIRFSLATDARAALDRAIGPTPLDPTDPFAVENRRLREEDRTLWDKAKKVFARQFAPGGLLPRATFGEKIVRDSEFKAADIEVSHLVAGLNKAVKAAMGKDMDSLTDAELLPLKEALAGKVNPAIPEPVRVALVAMRQYIDSLSTDYLGIVQGKIDELQDKAASGEALAKAAKDARQVLKDALDASTDPAVLQAMDARKAAARNRKIAKQQMKGLSGEARKAARQAYAAAEAAHEQAKDALWQALPPPLRKLSSLSREANAAVASARAAKPQAEAEAALYEKIKANIGAYVHRSYQAFDDPKWFKRVSLETRNAARQYLIDSHLENGETEAEARRMADVAMSEILKTGTAYDSMEAMIGEGKLGAKDLTVLIKRKEIAPQIRALLGEYADPRLNFAKSATKMARLVWNQRFLDKVRAHGMGTFLFAENDRPAEATVQFAGEQSDGYSPLNGLWTFPEVAQSFKDALGAGKLEGLYAQVVKYNGMVKYGKTILAPTTAMRNFQSALFFSLANGHFDMTRMQQAVAAFREQVTQNASEGEKAYMLKMVRLGVLYDTPTAGLMADLAKDARMEELLSSNTGTAIKKLRTINRVAQGFYSFGDDFWKVIGFENEKASLIGAGMAEAEAETMAAERIRNTYPTYSMIGQFMQKLRRFPLLGSFVSFPSEILRTSANMLRITAVDLKSDNPGIRALGRKRAAGMAMVSAGFYALAAMTAAALGVDDDEEEAVRDLSPPWSKNSTFLFLGRDEDGKLQHIDMSFLDPYGYLKRPLTAMLRDQPWEDAAVSGLKDLLAPFFGADIAASAIFQVLANQKPTGGAVYNEGGAAFDQAADIANHMRKALQPGFVGNAERMILAGTESRREGSGQPYTVPDELAGLVGWRASTLDAKTGLKYRAFDFGASLARAKKTLTRELVSSNAVSDGDIREARQAAEAQHQKTFTEMARLVKSAQAAGMSRMQVMQTLRNNGVSQANTFALINGRVPPLEIGMQTQAKAIRDARLMRDPAHAAEIARRFRVAREVQVAP